MTQRFRAPAPMPIWAAILLVVLVFRVLSSVVPERVPDAVAAVLERAAIERDPARMGARELRRLPGIGERRAQAVLRRLAQRDEEAQASEREPAPFSLLEVHGIGPKTDARIRAWLDARTGGPLGPAGL